MVKANREGHGNLTHNYILGGPLGLRNRSGLGQWEVCVFPGEMAERLLVERTGG